MPNRYDLLYEINGQSYWGSDFQTSGTLYCLNGIFYTQKQLKDMSSSWTTWYSTGSSRFTKEDITSALSSMGPSPSSTWGTYTRCHLEDILESFPPSSGPPDIASQCRDASTQTSTSGMNTSHPLKIEHEEGDDLIAKVLANMQAKTESVKGHKKLLAEVENLRKLLAEKEAALVESERVLELEVAQVKAD